MSSTADSSSMCRVDRTAQQSAVPPPQQDDAMLLDLGGGYDGHSSAAAAAPAAPPSATGAVCGISTRFLHSLVRIATAIYSRCFGATFW